LGIGVTNFAYWLAKNGAKYSGVDGNKLVHETFEAVQFYLLKASNLLASDKGACEWFGQTKYAKGLLPIDHYRKQLDASELNANHPLLLDWDGLRKDIERYGLRNSTLSPKCLVRRPVRSPTPPMALSHRVARYP
jgi:ribonucleoside-diphosphate reductase alpha chain